MTRPTISSFSFGLGRREGPQVADRFHRRIAVDCMLHTSHMYHVFLPPLTSSSLFRPTRRVLLRLDSESFTGPSPPMVCVSSRSGGWGYSDDIEVADRASDPYIHEVCVNIFLTQIQFTCGSRQRSKGTSTVTVEQSWRIHSPSVEPERQSLKCTKKPN